MVSGVIDEFEQFEFARGDILIQVKGSARYVVQDLEEYSYLVVMLDDGMMCRASKRWLEEEFVKVGEWDFDNHAEKEMVDA